MLSTEFRQLIAPQARVLNLIWMAMCFSTVVYAAIAWILAGPGGSEGSDPTFLRGLGLAVLVLLGFTATFYQRTALSEATLKKRIPADLVWPLTGAQVTPTTAQQGQALFDALSDSEKRKASLWPYYQTTLIVVWAILEAIGVIGLVLAIMQDDARIVIPFAGAALLMLILKRPRPSGFFAGLSL